MIFFALHERLYFHNSKWQQNYNTLLSMVSPHFECYCHSSTCSYQHLFLWFCRTCDHCSDVGKMTDCPVIHINGDFPEVRCLIHTSIFKGCGGQSVGSTPILNIIFVFKSTTVAVIIEWSWHIATWLWVRLPFSGIFGKVNSCC